MANRKTDVPAGVVRSSGSPSTRPQSSILFPATFGLGYFVGSIGNLFLGGRAFGMSGSRGRLSTLRGSRCHPSLRGSARLGNTALAILDFLARLGDIGLELDQHR